MTTPDHAGVSRQYHHLPAHPCPLPLGGGEGESFAALGFPLSPAEGERAGVRGEIGSPLQKRPDPAASAGLTTVTVVIPVYNEESRLAGCIERLVPFLATRCPWTWEVVIADNGSTDHTLEIARRLSERHPGVRMLHRDENGRGGALRQAWSESLAAVLSYMDVDLSSDLGAFPLLIERLLDGTFDLATGSRLLAPSSTRRSLKREVISRAYNFLVRSVFHTLFSDAQCGFKAITRKAARELLPLVEDNGWFLDTELLVMAETLGYRILDLPVRWLEGPESRVNVWRTVREDLAGICRLWQSLRRLEPRNRISLQTPACLRA